MIFEVSTSFRGDLVIPRSDIEFAKVALINQFVQMPSEGLHTKRDMFHLHILVDGLWRKGKAMRSEEVQYSALSGLLSHCVRHESNTIYPHRLVPNGNITFRKANQVVVWVDKWTTFIIDRLLGDANDSLGTNGPISNVVESARGGAECGRGNPIMNPTDRGRKDNRRPQNSNGVSYSHPRNYRGGCAA